MSLGFALVGCGRISKRYGDIFSTKQIKGAHLVSVCDVQLKRAKDFGKTHNVPGYKDMASMFAAHENKIDVVCILSESGLHAEHTLEVVKYKKHIVVEKPMALRLSDADDMIEACDKAGVKLFVVKQNRLNAPVIKLREAIEEGRFGKLVMGSIRVRWCRDQNYYNQDPWRGTWAYDGGVFANQAIHHIDLLQWMLGQPETVYASTHTALVDIECEDTGAAVINFKNGSIGVVEATTATRPKDIEGSLSILGERGMVEIGGFAVNQLKHWQFVDSRPEDDNIIKNWSTNPPNVYGFGHNEFLKNVVETIKHGKSSLVDGLEGRRSLELVCAMYESAETGSEVSLRFKSKMGRLGEQKK